jgi:hypothetical protein
MRSAAEWGQAVLDAPDELEPDESLYAWIRAIQADALEAAAKLFPVEHDEDAPRGSRVCVCDEYLACYIHKQLKTLIPKPDRS